LNLPPLSLQYSFVDFWSNTSTNPTSFNTKFYSLDNVFPTTGDISTYKAATTNDDPYFAGFDTQFFADPDLLE